MIDKPAGPTSHDVVNRIRRLYALKRVGHAGTLDPPATGILLVGLGRATRVLSFLQALPKTYRAVIRFGTTTTTQDATGDVVAERPCAFDRAALDGALADLTGDILQVPPMVSAVRVGGERLYKAARRGEEVERPARPVTVYEFSVESFDAAVWEATVVVRCSSGTYVRTLAADLGEALGCGAHLRSLRRESIGSLGDGVPLRTLEEAGAPEREAHVLPMAAALRDLPSVRVAGDELAGVTHGRALPEVAAPGAGEGDAVVIADESGAVVAVYRRVGGGLQPEAVLV
ncbi:MAG TPA: tRNA pseudouridine(55) synthase TruB [Actinomycetota bacterium]|nr:tRNA pseudouridine(55) synthase TruB [Actinomycetota bacterium]